MATRIGAAVPAHTRHINPHRCYAVSVTSCPWGCSAQRRDTLTGRGEMRVSVDYDFRAVQASPHAASLHAYPRCR